MAKKTRPPQGGSADENDVEVESSEATTKRLASVPKIETANARERARQRAGSDD